ncbi:hypothetical protein D9M69_427750 [compost metagenome]
MLRHAVQYLDDAGAADAFAALGVDVATMGLQHVDQAGVGRHLQHHAGTGQLHFERAGRSAVGGRVCGKVFKVNRIVRATAGRHFHHFVHERCRAAGIDVSGAAGTRQAFAQRAVQIRRLYAVMKFHVGGELRRQQLCKRRVLRRTGEVMQTIRLTAFRQSISHAQQRRHADTGGEQHVLAGAVIETEQVARRAHFQLHALFHLLVQRQRTTARLRFFLHRHQIRTAILRRAAQRILTGHPGRPGQVDVGTRFIGVERLAVTAHEAKGTDIQRFVDDPFDLHLHHCIT